MINSKIISVGWLSHMRNKYSQNGKSYGHALICLLRSPEFPPVTLIGVTRQSAEGIEEVMARGFLKNKYAKKVRMKHPVMMESGKNLYYAVTIGIKDFPEHTPQPKPECAGYFQTTYSNVADPHEGPEVAALEKEYDSTH